MMFACHANDVGRANDDADANDVCLTAHKGKHRIIAERSGTTSYLRSKCIISPQAIHHLTNENLRANSNRGLLVKGDRIW